MLSPENEYLLNLALKQGFYTYFELNSLLGSYDGERWEFIIGIPVKRFKAGFIVLTAFSKDKSEFIELCSQSIADREVRRIVSPYPVADSLKNSMNKTVSAMISVAGLDAEFLSNHDNIYRQLFGFSEETDKKQNIKSHLSKSANFRKRLDNTKQTGAIFKK